MQEKNYTGLIPNQQLGKSINACYTKTCDDASKAKALYQSAKTRLFNLKEWKNFAGALSAEFSLTDENGKEKSGTPEKGDHFRINIPGPGSVAGEGYDWVKVEAVKEVNSKDVESVAIRVRPTKNPESNKGHIAHFYSEDSTSIFVVTREANTVTASIYDRNIEANEETKQPVDKLRNAVVGLSAKHGFSKMQWQALCEGLIKG